VISGVLLRPVATPRCFGAGSNGLRADWPPFRQASERYPALRVARCEHHFIFCLPQEEEPALIVAILHERMDLVARVAARLE